MDKSSTTYYSHTKHVIERLDNQATPGPSSLSYSRTRVINRRFER